MARQQFEVIWAIDGLRLIDGQVPLGEVTLCHLSEEAAGSIGITVDSPNLWHRHLAETLIGTTVARVTIGADSMTDAAKLAQERIDTALNIFRAATVPFRANIGDHRLTQRRGCEYAVRVSAQGGRVYGGWKRVFDRSELVFDRASVGICLIYFGAISACHGLYQYTRPPEDAAGKGTRVDWYKRHQRAL